MNQLSEIPFIPVNEPLLDGNEKKYLIECIETGWISSEGPFVKRFEDQFAQTVDRQFAIAVTNGTAALDVAIEALGIGPGDEVIMPSFTIISCIHQIVRSGAIPVLVDSDPVTWNMRVDEIESKITKNTRALLIVHIYGLPVEMNAVLDIAKRYNLKVIEDAAEMHGQTYAGKPCGSFGDISIFSFYPNKHITTGEGGMIVTDDEDLAENCKSLRNLCFQPEDRFVHQRLGWNLRMTNMQAALGVAQLERLEFFVKKKRYIGQRYNELLSELSMLQKPLAKTENARNIYWVYGLVIHKEADINAKQAIKELGNLGIGCRPFFCPMHLQPVLLNAGLFQGESYPVSENLFEKGFYIPSGLALKDEQIDRVANAVIEVFK